MTVIVRYAPAIVQDLTQWLKQLPGDTIDVDRLAELYLSILVRRLIANNGKPPEAREAETKGMYRMPFTSGAWVEYQLTERGWWRWKQIEVEILSLYALPPKRS